MKRMSQVRSRWPSRWAVIVVLTMLMLMTSGTPSFAAPNMQGAIHRVYVTDVRDVYFVVSWTTDSISTGSVNYGPASPTCTLSSTANDVLNPAATTTHYVEVSGLTANTAYCFDVIARQYHRRQWRYALFGHNGRSAREHTSKSFNCRRRICPGWLTRRS